MKLTNSTYSFAFLLLITIFSSCKNETKQDTTTSTQDASEAPISQKGQAFIADDGSTPNVLQIAIGSPDHTTLVAAVQAASLENALVNAGPLMVLHLPMKLLPPYQKVQWKIYLNQRIKRHSPLF